MRVRGRPGARLGSSVVLELDGSIVGTQADQSNNVLSTTADATFSYSGAIDWSTSDPANLISEFLNLNDISGFSSSTYSSIAAFGNATLSDSGDTITILPNQRIRDIPVRLHIAR